MRCCFVIGNKSENPDRFFCPWDGWVPLDAAMHYLTSASARLDLEERGAALAGARVFKIVTSLVGL